LILIFRKGITKDLSLWHTQHIMIQIKPFKAIRPSREKVSLVPSRSYVSYTRQELLDRLKHNPFSFLKIINPDFDKRKILSAGKKFQAVKDAFSDFKMRGIFIQDSESVLYLYQQETPSAIFTGIIAGASVQDYLENRIKKHENTITRREKMFCDYLKTTGFNAEPVLLAHPEKPELQALYEKLMAARPEYEFTTTNCDVHRLWLIQDVKDQQFISQQFAEMDAVYIADGHHRSASSALLGKEFLGQDVPESYFMAFFVAEAQVEILEFNRLVRSGVFNPKQVWKDLKATGTLREAGRKPVKPSNKGEMTVYFGGKWYYFEPQPSSTNDPVKKLDASVLSAQVLEPVFGIKDLRKDPLIDFMPGNAGPEGLQRAVDSGTYLIGFCLFPVSMAEVKAVADAGKVMPPKSTYINPKLRSGLIIYDFKNA
jgi:uncharacterized protein (DUF1015 family)